MFTGLVQNLGTVIKLEKKGADLELLIHSDLPAKHFKKGASIAVDGVCLTVERYYPSKKNFFVTAVSETLGLTTLSTFKVNQRVNLEPPLTLGTSLGGHLTSGHVDGMGEVLQDGVDFRIQAPQSLCRFLAVKGSLVVNGVSLTIADLKKNQVRIALIPQTLIKTNLGLLKKGAKVNLEVDLIARYLDRLLTTRV